MVVRDRDKSAILLTNLLGYAYNTQKSGHKLREEVLWLGKMIKMSMSF